MKVKSWRDSLGGCLAVSDEPEVSGFGLFGELAFASGCARWL